MEIRFVHQPINAEGGTGSPGTGATGNREPLCGCWESNPGSPQEQSELVAADSSPQPLHFSLT